MRVRFVPVPDEEVMIEFAFFVGVFRRTRSGREFRGRTRRMRPRGRMESPTLLVFCFFCDRRLGLVETRGGISAFEKHRWRALV